MVLISGILAVSAIIYLAYKKYKNKATNIFKGGRWQEKRGP